MKLPAQSALGLFALCTFGTSAPPEREQNELQKPHTFRVVEQRWKSALVRRGPIDCVCGKGNPLSHKHY